MQKNPDSSAADVHAEKRLWHAVLGAFRFSCVSSLFFATLRSWSFIFKKNEKMFEKQQQQQQ